MAVNELEDAFIRVSFSDDRRDPQPQLSAPPSHPMSAAHTNMYNRWVVHNSNRKHDDTVYTYETLKELFPAPEYVITPYLDYGGMLRSFPEAVIVPDDKSDQIERAVFIAFPKASGIPGMTASSPVFTAHKVYWKASALQYNEFEFRIFAIRYLHGFGDQVESFIVHKGSKATVQQYIIAAGAWSEALHNEIYVYDNSFWEKDAALWAEVQKANWDDVILKPEFKQDLINDINGFYSQEKVYKDLGIPWKRGIIFHGPAGNGKTISMKATMKSVPATPLYVRNFNHWSGPEAAMKIVFEKARQNSPCLLVLEDLDALITPQTRSFFLNQVDGLDNNDGILIIGTTNYLERIDPALSKRPSRFDRKMLFDSPDEEERKLYCKYWQKKLSSNKDISFPDDLIDTIAKETDKFSFAFLKEAFVNTLVQLATGDEKLPFPEAVIKTIKHLRKEIGSNPDDDDAHLAQTHLPTASATASSPTRDARFVLGPQGPQAIARALQTHFQRLMEPNA
ncbi:P-loop containing nucleoside triphosphate hydrolase protein [Auriculariales sp. MPI-PUGE-AT-0066]|nr:P-loop containing nucleoside triphosphate hydrolase protein [Auriculariales sp. MPI-PUGE-AT-0066]